LRSSIKEKVEQIQSKRNKLDEEEQEKVKPLFKAHFGEQMKKEVEDRELFHDEWGGTIMILKTPKEVKKLKPTSTGNYLVYGVSPTLEKEVKMFVPSVEGLWDITAIFRGKMKVQYKSVGSSEFPISLEKFLKEWDVESLDEIDEGEYFRDYTLSVWQALAVIE
jgi:hypothetical protein